MQGVKLNILGRKFGRLRVLRRVSKPAHGRAIVYECVCDCGRKYRTTGSALYLGKCRSCGCGRGKPAVHGLTGTSIYYAWANMKQRCSNKRRREHKWYGGAEVPVTVCLGLSTFTGFYNVLGEKQDGQSLSRNLDLGNYSCGKCITCTRQGWKRNAQWANRREQGRQQRLKNMMLRNARLQVCRQGSKLGMMQ